MYGPCGPWPWRSSSPCGSLAPTITAPSAGSISVSYTHLLITNVGESHIELLGSRENIARAKSELFEALPAGVGRAFANLDDDFAAFMAERGRLSERSVALSGFAGHPDAALRGALERESAACDQAVWACLLYTSRCV